MPIADAIEHSGQKSEARGGTPVRQARQHELDYRISFSLLGQQIYFVVLAGCDMRSPARLERDGQMRSLTLLLIKAAFAFTFIVGLLLVTVGVTVLGLYLMKCFAGIDLFEGQSFLHSLLE